MSGSKDAPGFSLAGLQLADVAMGGPAARAGNGVNGTGIKIGILSDSYNVLGGAAGDIAQGLLPANGVTVLKEGPAGSTDEGRAMAELIHATAPGAQLYFYTAYDSEQDFANGMLALANAGCQVIVDDIGWADEPFFQEAGPVDAAAAQLVAAGVNEFSAAGNDGTNFFEARFTPAATVIPSVGAASAEQFPGGGFFQTATIPAGESVTLGLQWTANYAGANPATLTVDAVAADGSVIASAQPGGEPAALINFPTLGTTQTYRLYVVQTPGTPAPGTFKDILEGGGTLSGPGVGVGSGSIFGHDLVPGVNAVGAINVANTPAEGGALAPEPYSSLGPGAFLLSPAGAPLAAPETLAAPAFLTPDGADTTLFAPFDGTSASAAEAAAAAALVLEADPGLSNADVTAVLQDSALPAGAPRAAGAGLIQLPLAVRYAATRQITGSPQAVVRGLSQPCTVAGGAGAHLLVAGSGPALLASQGTDTVVTGAGADTVDLAGASALLFGGAGPLLDRTLGGADTVVGGTGGATVLGGAGGGLEWGSALGRDWLSAGNAPTFLVQGGAADTLLAAGAGNDTLFALGAGAATLLGGAASGGSLFVATASSGPDLILPGAGTNSVFLGTGAATVAGGAGRIEALAGSGNQLLVGGAAGYNWMDAGSGTATLVGAGGNDSLYGRGAGDLLVAAPGGDDTLFGGSGQETLMGGASGSNVLAAGGADAVIAPETANAVVVLGSGQSTVMMGAGAAGLDVVRGQVGGADFVTGFDPSRDWVRLAGYGADAAQAVAAQVNAGGNSWITLNDGTTIGFLGLAHLNIGNVATS